MAHTDRLYYRDCYLREFRARVVRTGPDPQGVRVYLDQTAFYPESGGQPADCGQIDGIAVLDVVDEGEEVAHVLATAPRESEVEARIDWERRFDHMQQHTGQHILSAAFERVGSYKTVSFHMGAESSTIDLDSDRLGAAQIEEAERAANAVVFENRPVRISFRSAGEAQQLELRKATDREGELRLVEVEEFDLSACGGTHVSQTGSVGMIGVRKVERSKDLTRVEFVCGGRARCWARQDYSLLSEAGQALSTSFENVPAMIRKQAQEIREASKALERAARELAGFEAERIWQDTPEANGVRLIRLVLDASDLAKGRVIAQSLSKRPGAIALIGVRSEPATLVFAQAPDGKTSIADILKQTLAKFGGRGGGSREFAQGGGFPQAQLEAALDFAQALCLQQRHG